MPNAVGGRTSPAVQNREQPAVAPATDPRSKRLDELRAKAVNKGWAGLSVAERRELRTLTQDLRPRGQGPSPELTGLADTAPDSLRGAAWDATAKLKTLNTEATRLANKPSRTTAEDNRLFQLRGELKNVSDALNQKLSDYLEQKDPQFAALGQRAADVAAAKNAIAPVSVGSHNVVEAQNETRELEAGGHVLMGLQERLATSGMKGAVHVQAVAYNAVIDKLLAKGSTGVTTADRLGDTSDMKMVEHQAEALRENLASRGKQLELSRNNMVMSLLKELAG